jgi:hypothetical protein
MVRAAPTSACRTAVVALDVHDDGLLQVDQIVRGTRVLMACGHVRRLGIDNSSARDSGGAVLARPH